MNELLHVLKVSDVTMIADLVKSLAAFGAAIVIISLWSLMPRN